MNKVLFFDGHCNLCNASVDALMRWDKNHILKFSSLQGKTAKVMLPAERITSLDPDTVIYLRDGKLYDRTTAILLSLYDIGGIWPVFSVFLVVPKFLRDLVYKFVAKIRYKVFGRRETCRLPEADEMERLLP